MRAAAYFALIASLALWAGNWIVGRAVREDISPAVATLGRVFIVMAAVLPFALPGLRSRLKALSWEEWKALLLAGFFGGGVHLAMQWEGLRTTTATSATLFLSTSPVFILLLAPRLLGERVSARQWLGIGVSFLGIAAIVSEGRPAALSSLSFNRGDLFALGSMFMWALYTIMLKRRRDPLDMPQFLLVLTVIGAICLSPWVAWELATEPHASLSRNGMLAILYSGIGSFLLAYLGWSYAVTRLGAARAGPWMHGVTAFGVLLAALVLGEYPAWYHFAGIGLILAGLFTASSASSSR
ncbi:MAG TPA: DMT family transporter [Burkholderiales bacterium]|nr:DMT family transporter [Burkholderiales bacterium]